MSADKPPSLDQDGKMINPHNPEFITKVPWYLGSHGPTLKHHNLQTNDHELSLAETDRIIAQKVQAQQQQKQQQRERVVFRKGSCKNCGAATHQERDCLERPRSSKKSAWKSGVDIANDDVVLDLSKHGKLSYAAKRDNWQGYDPNEYKEIMERHDRMESDRLKNKISSASVATSDQKDVNQKDDSDSDSESEKEHKASAEKHDFVSRDEDVRDFQGTIIPQGGVGGAGMRVTVRNLRLREDTPKYLRNLSLDSAFYDPKSRSMRANPYPNANPDEVPYAGDNFLRYSGDALALSKNQVLCWEMQARGENIDVISNPSQAELLHKLHAHKKEEQKNSIKEDLLKKYGDAGSSLPADQRLLLGQSEHYVEYTTDGKTKASQDSHSVSTVTKYCEDEFPLNHKSVWGSFYDRGNASWGYQCCRSTLKNSYCVGSKMLQQTSNSTNNKRPFSNI